MIQKVEFAEASVPLNRERNVGETMEEESGKNSGKVRAIA